MSSPLDWKAFEGRCQKCLRLMDVPPRTVGVCIGCGGDFPERYKRRKAALWRRVVRATVDWIRGDV